MKPSRHIPKREKKKLGYLAKLFLCIYCGGFLWGLGSLIHRHPWTALPIGLLVLTLTLATLLSRRKFKRLREARREESICTFVRSLPIRELDTSVVRATYEELTTYVGNDDEPFPIHASDQLNKDLEIHKEDLFGLFYDIATRSGRTLDELEKNPFWPDLKTVEDLIRAITWQKRDLSTEDILRRNAAEATLSG